MSDEAGFPFDGLGEPAESDAMNKTSVRPRQNGRRRPNLNATEGGQPTPGVRGKRPLPDFEADAKRIFGAASKFGDVLLGKYGDSIL